MEVDQLGAERQVIVDGNPLSNRGEVSWRIAQSRGDWNVAVEATTTVTSDTHEFHVEARIVATEGDDTIHDITMQRSIPRDHL